VIGRAARDWLDRTLIRDLVCGSRRRTQFEPSLECGDRTLRTKRKVDRSDNLQEHFSSNPLNETVGVILGAQVDTKGSGRFQANFRHEVTTERKIAIEDLGSENTDVLRIYPHTVAPLPGDVGQLRAFIRGGQSQVIDTGDDDGRVKRLQVKPEVSRRV
jgi:hypothetical protein